MVADDALTEDEAARFLGVSPSFLAKRRCYGDGPAFIKYGAKRVVYLKADLEVYRRTQRRLNVRPTKTATTTGGRS